MEKNHTKTLMISSMLAAMIFVITYLVKIYYSFFGITLQGNPYINLGDSVIYCTGMLIGAPWAAGAAAIGSAFADLALGSPAYIIPTFFIKGTMGLVCALLAKNAKLPRFILVSTLGGAIMVSGYGIFEWLSYGWGNATISAPFNLIQWAAGVIGAIVLYYPVKRIKGII